MTRRRLRAAAAVSIMVLACGATAYADGALDPGYLDVVVTRSTGGP